MKGLSMKTILLSLITVLVFSGCQQKQEDQAAHDAKVAQQAREQLLLELKAKEEAERKAREEAEKKGKLAQAGIETTPDGKIIIDTNKTKSYLQKLAEIMKKKVNKLSKDMEKGMIEEKEIGIEVNETHIEIDINKTQTFLEKWSHKMEEFVKEFDKIAKEIDNTTKGH